MRIQDLSWPRMAAPRGVRGATLDQNGAAMVEFAFVAPLFIALLCAIIEFSGIMFVQAILEGSAREASRYGLTGFTSGGVSREDQILSIVEDNTYGDIGQPEPFTDENGNAVWDNDEPYTDINGNGTWDPDMGAAGLGGPGTVVVYRMSYDWNIMIPLFYPIFGNSIRLESNIAVRNEPFTPPPPAP